jgi:hypothetical protein
MSTSIVSVYLFCLMLPNSHSSWLVTDQLDLTGHQKAALWVMSLAFGWFGLVSLIVCALRRIFYIQE